MSFSLKSEGMAPLFQEHLSTEKLNDLKNMIYCYFIVIWGGMVRRERATAPSPLNLSPSARRY